MRTYISASSDATIYERFPTFNTGLDEIIEIGKEKKSSDTDLMYSSSSVRFLINFDLSNSSSWDSSANYYLNLYIANAKDVHRYQEILVYPVSQSWVEGSGYRYQDWKNVEDGVDWYSASVSTPWTTEGGDYITSVSSSYTFSQVPIRDVKIDITNIMSDVVSGSAGYDWNGLLVKFTTTEEQNSRNKGNIKFFSSNTHTVFAPKIEIVWNDQTFSTGSLKPIPDSNVSIIPKNIKQAYTVGEVDRVRLVVRDPYPDKRFDAKKRYQNKYYLPSESYYRITDEVSGVKIHDFDSYSAINCDASGSYILLDTSGLDVDRHYMLELKVKNDSLVYFPEFRYSFKVDADG